MEYTRRQRECFRYEQADGTPVFADPLLTRRHLVALLGGDINRVAAELKSDDAGIRYQATLLATGAACEAFGLEPFSPDTGEGTLAGEAIALLRGFLLWLESKKKSGVTTPASSSGA